MIGRLQHPYDLTQMDFGTWMGLAQPWILSGRTFTRMHGMLTYGGLTSSLVAVLEPHVTWKIGMENWGGNFMTCPAPEETREVISRCGPS